MSKPHVLTILYACCVSFACAAAVTSSAQTPSPAAQTPPQSSFDKGQSLADQTLNDLRPVPGAAAQAGRQPTGYLIAEGDSWFAYPGLDVLGALEGGIALSGSAFYKVYSSASPGDTVESMAYDGDQLEGFAHEFRKVADAGKQAEVKAIVLSGGGNDIAGRQFHVLLNHSRASGTTELDGPVADAFVDRIGRSLESLIGTSVRFADQILGRQNVPIIVHGYAHPVPDGRPFGIGWPLPGPWLEPGFTAKGYPHATIAELERNTRVMADLIARFNKRVASIPNNLRGRADVRYVDVSAALSNVVPGDVYKRDWSNELHPTNDGFKRVAEAFHRAIQRQP